VLTQSSPAANTVGGQVEWLVRRTC